MNMALFDHIALLEAELNPKIKQSVDEARRNDSTLDLLFWAPLSIDGHPVIVQVREGCWQATNVDNILADGVHIRMSQNYWNELQSPQAFLKWGACPFGAKVDDWICFKVIFILVHFSQEISEICSTSFSRRSILGRSRCITLTFGA